MPHCQATLLSRLRLPAAGSDGRFSRLGYTVVVRLLSSDAGCGIAPLLARVAAEPASPSPPEALGPVARVLLGLARGGGLATASSASEALTRLPPAAVLAPRLGFDADAWRDALQPAFVEASVRVLLMQPAPLAPSALAASAALLSTATEAQLATSIAPALTRALRTRVDVTSVATAAVVLAALPPLSPAVAASLAEAVTAAAVGPAASSSSSDAARSAAALLAFGAVAAAGSAGGLAQALVASAGAALSTKKSPLWQSRIGVTRVLGAAAAALLHRRAPPSAELAALASEGCGVLSGALVAEAHDAVRAAAAGALGLWLAVALAAAGGGGADGLPVPAGAIEQLVKGLGASAVVAAAAAAGGAPPPPSATQPDECAAFAALLPAAASAPVGVLGDGFAEGAWLALTAAGTEEAAASRGLARCPSLVAALVDLVARVGGAALASKRALSPATMANSAYAVAALVRMAVVSVSVGGGGEEGAREESGRFHNSLFPAQHDTTVADAMAAARIVAAPAAGAAAAAAATPAAGAKKAATAAAPAAKGKAPPAAPVAATARAVSTASAGGAPTAASSSLPQPLCVWDVLTAKELAGALLSLPSRLDPGLPGAAPLLEALADTLAVGLGEPAVSGRVAAFPRAYVAAVLADLAGGSTGADGSEAPRRAASPLFSALTLLLSHEVASVRVRAARRLAEVRMGREASLPAAARTLLPPSAGRQGCRRALRASKRPAAAPRAAPPPPARPLGQGAGRGAQ